MPQISNLSFNVSFEPHNPNRVGLTNTTPSLPAGFVGIFKVTQPDGYVRNGDINTPDVTNVVSSCVVTLVPDSAGQLQQGQYIIEFIGNAPGYLSTSFIRTFTLQYTAATISLRNDFDVFTPQLAYTDISNYNVSGYTISSGPTRKWDATSATTGTISGTNSSIDIKYNNQYYAETYTIQFEVNVAYVSQAYPWLTITHTRTQSTTVTACIPKSLEDLTQAVEALREESNASCGGDWAKFEKANALYAHLLNMLRLVLIAGQQQSGFFDVYQQLLTYIQNGSVACDSIGQVIPPYDFSDYESSIYDGQSSYCQLVGDGVNTVYRVNHQLGDQCVVVQVYEVATGKQVFCDVAVSTINSIDITFFEPPTLNQYRVVAVAGALGLRGQGFQPGGLTGQILRKKTNADFDTEWADVVVALPLLVPYNGATQSVYLGEYGIEAGFVRLDTTPTATPATPAVMSWNDTDGTAEIRLKGNNVTLQVGQEMVARVVNKTGANLLGSQYKAVRVRKVSEGGAQGQRLAVVLAQANTEFMSTDMLGIVTENIDNNQEGFITTFGAVKNIDTTGALQGEVWADGDILFLSPTVPGGLTKVKPSAPNHLSIVGYVEYAHQNNGKIFVHVQTSWELDELHNVSITNPVNNQVLKYNGTLWVNSTFPAVTSVGLATATSGVTITDTPVTSSGVININIATASASSNGLLSSADWATFNAKQSALTFGNISTATSGVTITNGNASTVGPNVSISIATAGSGQNGLLSAADWATFNAKQSAITLTTTGNSGAATFVGSTLNIPNYTLAGLGGVPTTRSLTINGTAYDLSADRTWSVGTVTSVAALTIGTAGTDITSTVATGTTTPVITLNVPTASAANRGALSAADWTTFNAKVGGSGTINYVPKFTAAGTIGNSQIFDNGTNVGVGEETSPTYKLESAVSNAGGIASPLQLKNYAFASASPGQGVQIAFANERGATSSNGYVSGLIRTQITNIGNGASAMSFHNWSGTEIVERMRLTSAGNLGIRTNNPTVGLVVNSSAQILGNDAPASGVGLELYSNGTKAGTIAYNRTGSAYIPHTFDASQHEFLLLGVERMRIFANGRIGINTTTDAGYQLDVNGTLRSVNGANFATTSGNVGIGTASPSTLLTISKTGAGTIGPNLRLHNTSARQTGNSARISFAPNSDYTGTTTAAYIDVIDTEGIPANPSAMAFGVGAGGSPTERLRITSGGNVGIGTASPSTKMHVVGSATTLGVLRVENSQNRVDVNHGTINIVNTKSYALGNDMGIMFSAYRSDNTAIDPRASIAALVASSFGAHLTFSTRSGPSTYSEKMRITEDGELLINTTTDAGDYKLQVSGNIYNTGSAVFAATSGNVGIGTASPTSKLDVLDGDISVNTLNTFSFLNTNRNTIPSGVGTSLGGLRYRAYSTGTTYQVGSQILSFSSAAWSSTSSPSYLSFQTTPSGSVTPSERMVINASGNVGVGVTPSAWDVTLKALQVGNSLSLLGQGGAAEIGFNEFYDGTNYKYISSSTATLYGLNQGQHRWYIAPSGTAGANITWTQVMTLNASGNLGIGTTSPTSKLHISTASGSIFEQITSGANQMYLGYDVVGDNMTVQSNGSLALHTGSLATERMRIFANGRVAINTTTDAGYQLDVNGGTRVTGRVTVTGNDTLGLSITRAGTSAIASETYNGGGDNGWLLWGVESSAGGVIFPGTTAYASVFGSFRSVPVQFATNNTVRMTIDGGGSVGIGVASPSASAILQVDSTTKGMLPPRMTTTQRDAITSPATGLIVYDTTVNKLSVYNGTTWKCAQYE